MEKYNVDEKDVIETVKNPTTILDSHSNRVIFQRDLNGYALKVICEKVKSTAHLTEVVDYLVYMVPVSWF